MEEEEGQVAVMVEETYERLDKVGNIHFFVFVFDSFYLTLFNFDIKTFKV